MGNANEGSSMTQIDAARAGTITREMAIVAEKEGRDPEFIREGLRPGASPSPPTSTIPACRPKAWAAACARR